MPNFSVDGAIGVFDSGVGGLTVFKRIAERLPHESLVYLGDTARVPYGTKSAETVVRYATSCAQLLYDEGVKLLVVACNTASAYSLDALRDTFPIPILGVIVPGAQRSLEVSRNKRIGVIGTKGTIASGAYQAAIQNMDESAVVFTRPCPLLVPLAEEGWLEGSVPEMVAREYLAPLLEREIDTLVLGCTHYPLLKSVIQSVTGPHVQLVDSADATAIGVEKTLVAMEMHNCVGDNAWKFLVTDSPSGFVGVGERFLGRAVSHVEWVDI